MAKDDYWYTSSSWTSADQQLFNEKVTKSRDNFHKQQYARIKACALIETDDSTKLRNAVQILERSLKEWQCEFPSETDHTYAVLGDAYRSLKDYANAINAYEHSITWNVNVIHRGYWNYSEMIVSEGLLEKFKRAYEIVNRILQDEDELILETDKFIYHAVRAIVLQSHDRNMEARKESLAALFIATRKTSFFKFHPQVGLVNTDKYAALLEKLNAIIS